MLFSLLRLSKPINAQVREYMLTYPLLSGERPTIDLSRAQTTENTEQDLLAAIYYCTQHRCPFPSGTLSILVKNFSKADFFALATIPWLYSFEMLGSPKWAKVRVEIVADGVGKVVFGEVLQLLTSPKKTWAQKGDMSRDMFSRNLWNDIWKGKESHLLWEMFGKGFGGEKEKHYKRYKKLAGCY
ncbi:hypothetical protein LTR09_006635 [Extremus antarcticus]|uniref:Uncharacterized protein n=1 Tax=Extremus antarcticus TaxID=702011 RepID=A0AAJ0DLZ1_9PEZI|nr:hypothetical protein LTR09_006635 [Extremus antarcticus]